MSVRTPGGARTWFAAMAVSLAWPCPGESTVIRDFNEVLHDAVRETGGMPAPLARTGAMVNVAMADAVAAATGSFRSYHYTGTVGPGVSAEAAAAQAAYGVLRQQFPAASPALQARFDAALSTALASVADPVARSAGIDLGHAVSNDILALRGNDGSQVMMPYAAGANAGDWRPTPPDFTMPFNADWPAVTPWVMTSGSQFRPGLPGAAVTASQLLASPEYAAAFDEVRHLGGRANTALTAVTRTPEQTDIASFWANDRDGTLKPSGHLNAVAAALADQKNLSLAQEARLFGLLNLALADAALVSWDRKYATDVDLWRPITGILLADADGNALTTADPAWEPWSNEPSVNGFTPPFPSYTSGHATFAGAAAAILAAFFGTDAITFSIGTDDPGYTGPALRSYTSISQMALEDAISRIYLGVHWRFDAEDGYASGAALGQYVYSRAFAPMPEPATVWTGLGALAAAAATALGRRRQGCCGPARGPAS